MFTVLTLSNDYRCNIVMCGQLSYKRSPKGEGRNQGRSAFHFGTKAFLYFSGEGLWESFGEHA